jgi:ribA/ribD-fused uncharacterized protein
MAASSSSSSSSSSDEYKQALQRGEVWFYRTNEVPYGCFSNFYASPLVLDGKEWPTSEHWFQAQKFKNEDEIQERIRKASTPAEAAKIGRDRTLPRRDDWDDIRDEKMYDVVLAKFTQHPNLQKILLDSGDLKLVEHTKIDSYWADGGDGSGKNILGVVLQRVRETIRNSQK